MWRLLGLISTALAATVPPDPARATWQYVEKGTSGVLALEAIVVSPTLVIFFDRATNDPLQINNHSAWGALWNLETNTATALDVLTDSFCASGALLSNGSMVSLGGNIPVNPAAGDGRMGIRIFEPCDNPAGVGCTLFENPETHHLAENRWYASSVRIFDGSLLVAGGIHELTPFYNVDPVNNYEFFPKKDGGVPRPSDFLTRTVPVNLFPRTFALPDGKVFIAANNQSIIYDVEKNTETRLPDIPNGVRVTNPFDGTAALLPLSPPSYVPEVLVCGGTATDDQIPSDQLSSQTPASDQCSRLTLTPAGIRRGWVVEKMLETRIMPELILLPNGKLLIQGGAHTGYAAIASVGDPVGNSNADHPVFTPSLYDPEAPLGQRITNNELPANNIARIYHSTTTLTPQGNILLAGSNPNPMVVNDTVFPTEFRVQTLNPPYMSQARPVLSNVPKQIGFNRRFTINVSIPPGLSTSFMKVALMDLGFSSHAFHSNQRLVFMDAQLSLNKRQLTILSPPNNRVYPPGPAWIFLTVDGVTSEGTRVMVGNGASPPVADQGIPL